MVDLGLFVVFFSVVLVGFCLALVGLSETAPHEPHLTDDASLLHGRRLFGEDHHHPAFAGGGGGGSQQVAWGSGQLGLGSRMLADAAAASAHVFDSRDLIREDFATRQQSAVEATQVELGLVWQPFWAMFAEFDLDELSRIPFGLPLMWVYVLIANVVLVNMLIAMFAETYARIKRNAFIEYRYQVGHSLPNYGSLAPHSPPNCCCLAPAPPQPKQYLHIPS